MKKFVVEIHGTDLIGTCDKSGECDTLGREIGTLGDMGVDQDAIDTIVEYRHGVCASLGRCSLYYGLQKDAAPRVIESDVEGDFRTLPMPT